MLDIDLVVTSTGVDRKACDRTGIVEDDVLAGIDTGCEVLIEMLLAVDNKNRVIARSCRDDPSSPSSVIDDRFEP